MISSAVEKATLDFYQWEKYGRGYMLYPYPVHLTNTKEYEVGNIKKCFSAGYAKVFVCSNNTVHLEKIKNLCQINFNKEELKIIFCCGTEELFTYLSTTQKQPEEKTVKGYRVKVNVTSGINANSKQQVANTILKSIQRIKK